MASKKFVATSKFAAEYSILIRERELTMASNKLKVCNQLYIILSQLLVLHSPTVIKMHVKYSV